MSAQTWFVIYISAFSISAVLFITAVILFIKLNIPVIIGDLSGRTAKKQIRRIRDSNAAENSQMQIPGIYNSTHRLSAGKSPSVKFETRSGKESRGKTGETRGRTQFTGRFSDTGTDKVTEELGNKTELLNPDSMTGGSERTVCLSETMVLSPVCDDIQIEKYGTAKKFNIVKSIVVIHCNEVI